MASKSWRKGSPEWFAEVRHLRWVLLGLITFITPAAHADVDLAFSSDGFAGAWQIAGPYPGRAARQIDISELTPKAGTLASKAWGGVWQPHGTGNGALDLKSILNTSARGGQVALATAELVLPKAFDGWFLLSADGSVDVRVDGKSLFARESQRLRGNSWDAIPLAIPPGTHRIVLILTHPGEHWAFEARLLERANLRPPANGRFRLLGVDERAARQLLRTMTLVALHAQLGPGGFRPELRVSHPRGMPLIASATPVKVEAARPEQSFEVGSVVVNQRGVHPLSATLPYLGEADLLPGTRNSTFVVSVGGERFEQRISTSSEAIELARRASTLLDRLPKTASPEEDIVAATTEWMLAELTGAADSRHAYQLAEAAARLRRWLASLAAPALPFLTPGVHELAHYSDLDDAPQPFRVHVPAGFDPKNGKRYPAVLALHGHNGSPKGILDAFVDNHSLDATRSVTGFVLAPEAHGNAFYRGPGEHEAMAVLALAKRVYPIDDSRVAVTGVSMGGTGTAQLALRYSDDFAAAAPLCGYHSYFIRRDTRGKALSSWETARMHHWSTSSWAANGRHVPLFVAHGTRDFPLENSRVLIQTYQKLGLSVAEEWPDTGHSVWKVSYRGARLWPWLTNHTRPDFPDHVTVRTDALRYGQQYWVNLTRLQTPGTMAEVDAVRSSPGDYALSTTNVSGVSLLLPPAATALGSKVSLDGQTLNFGPGEPVAAFRVGAAWSKRDPAPGTTFKKAGVEGPIRDVFLDRVTFVYGSRDEHTRRANREVAETFGRFHSGMDITYPVVSDRDLEADVPEKSSLVLVGNPRDHSVLARVAPKLPIRAEAGGILVGDERIDGTDIGAIFIHPNPEHPDHYVVVLTAPSAAGIWRALSLPALLPDFLVYDAKLADAAHEQVLGTAQARKAGFFANDWSLPKSP